MFTLGYWIGNAIFVIAFIGLFLWAFSNDRIMSWFISRVVDIEMMYTKEYFTRKEPEGYFTGDEDL